MVVGGYYFWHSIQPNNTSQENNVEDRETLENVGEGRLEVQLGVGEHKHTEDVASRRKSQQEVAEFYQQLAPELLELVTEYEDQHHPGHQGYYGLVVSFI